MSSNYFRVLIKVKCNICETESYDADVEETHIKETSKNTFESWVTMDCPCGGEFEVIL